MKSEDRREGNNSKDKNFKSLNLLRKSLPRLAWANISKRFQMFTLFFHPHLRKQQSETASSSTWCVHLSIIILRQKISNWNLQLKPVAIAANLNNILLSSAGFLSGWHAGTIYDLCLGFLINHCIFCTAFYAAKIPNWSDLSFS